MSIDPFLKSKINPVNPVNLVLAFSICLKQGYGNRINWIFGFTGLKMLAMFLRKVN
jgi:hypothetical protein